MRVAGFFFWRLAAPRSADPQRAATKIPEMAQIMPSRWAYEGLIALHLNNSRYGEIEKLEKLEADINTSANNNDFDKPEDPKALKGWKSALHTPQREL